MLGTECYDPFELALLGSTRADEPPPHALTRAAAALGVALPAAGLQLVGGAGASSAAAATVGQTASASSTIGAAATMSQPVIAKVTLAMVAKHVAVGMVAGTVAVGGAQGAYHVMSSPQSRPAASVELIAPVLGHEHGSPTAPRRAAGRLAPTLEAMTVDETPTSQVDHPRVPATGNENTGRLAFAETELEHFSDDANQPGEDDITPAPNAVDPDSVAAFALPSAERPAAPPAAQRVREEPKGLSAERRFLLRARAAIGRHDPAGALRELDAHAARFPRGRLKGQANVLRVEALLQAERREEALTVGRGEILRAPSRQKVKRIRELFDRKPEQ